MTSIFGYGNAYLSTSGGTMSGTLSMGVNPIKDVTETLYTSNAAPDTPPTSGLAVYTSGNQLNYKDQTGTVYTLTTSVAGGYLPLAGGTMSGAIAMGANNITNIGTISGAITTSLVDNLITNAGKATSGRVATFSSDKIIQDGGTLLSDLATNASLATYLPLAGGTMTGVINMGAQEINNIAALRPSTTNIIYGRSAYALSTDNVVIGESASGTGGCVVIGSGAASSFANTITIGHSASSNSADNVTIGTSATSASSYNVVIGSNASSSAAKGVAIGSGATCADNGVTVGRQSTATANFGVICGPQSAIGAFRSIVIGPLSTSYAASANIIGDSLNNSIANSLLIGASTNIRASTTTCDLGSAAFPFQSLYLNTGIESTAGLVIGPTSATSIAIGRATITSTINGIFATALAQGSWYSTTTYNPSFAAGVNRLTPPTAATAGTLVDFTHSLGVLTYTGTRTRQFRIAYNITFTAGATGSNMTFFSSIAASTTIGIQAQQKQQVFIQNAATQMAINLVDNITLTTGQSVQLAGASATLSAAVGYDLISCTISAMPN